MTEGWSRYYEAAKGGGPRETLRLALDLFESEGGGGERLAVDLGCGEGRDTLELLRRGWRVLAIDAEPEAIERLRARPDLDSDAAARLATLLVSFEEAEWRQADLVNSSFALPFCPPDQFPALSGSASPHRFGAGDDSAASCSVTATAGRRIQRSHFTAEPTSRTCSKPFSWSALTRSRRTERQRSGSLSIGTSSTSSRGSYEHGPCRRSAQVRRWSLSGSGAALSAAVNDGSGKAGAPSPRHRLL
jgi:hypothetical protein